MNRKTSVGWLSKSQYAGINSLGLEEGIRPLVKIRQEAGKYLLKVADDLEELLDALALRQEVFFGHSEKPELRDRDLDMDEYDLAADHLVLIDQEINKVVGTYRLIHGERAGSYYSQGEFAMGEILSLEGRKLELGRACVHPDYRDGTVIGLIWQGLGAYLKASGAKWLFGCSSVELENEEESYSIGAQLMRKYYAPELPSVTPLSLHPKEALRFGPEMRGNYSGLDRVTQRAKIPALLRTYLNAGAKVCGAPAYDPEFQTLDFFTLMDVDQMNPGFVRRFGVR